METIALASNWNIERIIDSLDQHGYALIDDAYSSNYLKDLVIECTSNLDRFRDAAIQNGVVSNIRSDHIFWINDELIHAQHHIQQLMRLAQEFNRYFYLGIQEVEAHFACYNAGEFYALHRDNPQGKNGRMISSVLYLHQDWQSDWGGELRLQDKHDRWHIIEPKPNRIALFQSDLMHEVLPSKQQRLSITGWLRSQNSIW